MSRRTMAGENPYDVLSLIHEDHRLIREAEKLGADHQGAIDDLIAQLRQGNQDPGIGTKRLGFGGIFEGRARNGARVYFRVSDGGSIEIVGRSAKRNQQRVISILEERYGQ